MARPRVSLVVDCRRELGCWPQQSLPETMPLTTAFLASLCRKEGSPWLRGELGLSQSNRAALVGIHPSIYRPFIKSE